MTEGRACHVFLGSVASAAFVLRQAQHEDTLFVASPNDNNLILSPSSRACRGTKDEAAAPAAGNSKIGSLAHA
jgi:hypothetical protein